MNIFLVRHLPTEFNMNGTYMGRSQDLRILEHSIQPFQERIKVLIPSECWAAPSIGHSPMLRCKLTAQVLVQALGVEEVPLSCHAQLTEVDYGEFEGKKPDLIKQLFPTEFRMWMEDPQNLTFPGGESFVAAQERAVAFLHEIIRGTNSENIFLVTHVDIIKLILCWLMDIPINCKRMFRIDNGSITWLETTNEIYNKKKLRARSVNQT